MSAVSKSLRKELHLKQNEEAYEITLGGVCRGGACCLRRAFVVTHNQILYQEDPLCATKTTKSISIQKVTDVSIVQPCCWCINDLTLDTGSGQELYVRGVDDVTVARSLILRMKSDSEHNGNSKSNETTNLLSQDFIQSNRNAIVDLQKVSTQNNQELSQIRDLLVGVKSSIDNLNNTMITMNQVNNQAPLNVPLNVGLGVGGSGNSNYNNENNHVRNFGAIGQMKPLSAPSSSQPGLVANMNAPIYPPPRGHSNPDEEDGEKEPV